MNNYFSSLVIGDHISELPKSPLPASAADEAGHYPFICSSEQVKTTTTWLQEKPAVLMGTGGVASVNYGEGRFAYSTDTWGFRSNNVELNNKFLFRKIQQYLPRIDYAGFEGSGLKHLRKDFVRKLRIDIPTPTVQSRIVDVLDGCDCAIEKTEFLIAKYQQIKAGLMHDLFTSGVTADGKLRPPREQAPELYQETPIGWIPKEWTHGPLATFLIGGPKNGYSPREVDEWRGCYALGLGCLTNEGFRPVQLKMVDGNAAKESGSFLSDGDLLVSRSNTSELVGLCGIYRDIGSPCIYPDLMMRIRPNASVTSEYLEKLLLNRATRNRLTALAVGTSGSMVKLNAKSLLSLSLAVPSDISEQHRILAILAPSCELINRLEVEKKKLQHQKAGLMHDLLTGRVPVTV